MSFCDEKIKYERWWLNKKCRRALSRKPFRLVTGVRVIGPPSGFNAIVDLTYDDGETELIGPPARGGFKPNKTAVEVEPELSKVSGQVDPIKTT
jgi:hypothetical protein